MIDPGATIDFFFQLKAKELVLKQGKNRPLAAPLQAKKATGFEPTLLLLYLFAYKIPAIGCSKLSS